jgi:hypothetical protein
LSDSRQFPVSQKTIDFATQVTAGVCYRSSYPSSTRNSQFLSFLSPNFELELITTFIPPYFFHFDRPSRRYGSKKVWLFFISDYPLKKMSWLSVFNLKRSCTQK